jgi:membrane protease YdiL (CAAX protease family)
MAEQDREFALLCPHCGEENPPEFPVCWSCHGDLPATAPAEAGEERQARRPPATGAARKKRLLLELAVVLSVVWVPWFASGLWNALDPPADWPLASMLWHTVHGGGLLALLFYLAWLDGDWRTLLGLERPRITREILWGLLAWVAMHIANALAYRITSVLGLEARPPREEIEQAALWFAPATFLVFAWLEEVFYRAFLWSRLTELTRRPLLSIAITSVLFSAAHVYPLDASLALFFTGMTLGWIFAVRRSLWGLVLAHWLFNVVVTYLR